MISEDEIDAAEERGQQKARTGLYATSATYDPQSQTMHVALRNGFSISFPKERSEVMASAADEDLTQVEVQGTGNYIIFPRLDDGFTIDGMLSGHFGSPQWEEAWAEKHLHSSAA